MPALTSVLRLAVDNHPTMTWTSTGTTMLGLAASRMADMVLRVTPVENRLVARADDSESLARHPLRFFVRYPFMIR